MAKAKPTVVDGVAWTPALREQVWPSRPGPGPRLDPLEKLLDDRRDYLGQHGHLLPKHAEGRSHAAAHLVPLMDAVSAMSERPNPEGPLDLDVEAAIVALERVPVFSSMKFWLVREGPAFALKALVRSHQLNSSARTVSNYGHPIFLREGWDAAHRDPEYADSAWETMRGVVNAADDAAYATLRALADTLRKGAPSVVRAFLAFAFSPEHEWADEAAAAVIKEAPAVSGWCRNLITVASVDHGVALARNEDWIFSERQLLTMLARHGSAAAPVLLAAMEAAPNNTARKTYAKVLAMIETEAAALGFAKLSVLRTYPHPFLTSIPQGGRVA